MAIGGRRDLGMKDFAGVGPLERMADIVVPIAGESINGVSDTAAI